MNRKKGVSPVISTVLLIMIVIILAIIILLWTRGFVRESILKEVGGQEKTIEKFCGDVKIETFNDPDGTFGFHNKGNVPLYSYNLKTKKSGDSTIHERNEIVNPGTSTRIEDLEDYDYYDEVSVIPVLLGRKKSGGNDEFTCPEREAILI